MTNPVGRPTKYNDEILVKTRFYIDNYSEDQFGEAIPTEAGLSIYLKIDKDTVFRWANEGKHPEFSRLVKELKSKQELVLLTGGLNSKLNASITKLCLNKHGYNEKVEQTIDQTNSGEINLNIKHID